MEMGRLYNPGMKFNNTYRIPSARHPQWDYGSNAAYYVTICTKNRIPSFGTIDKEALEQEPVDEYDGTRMHKTSLGKTAQRCWMDIPHHFPFVRLDAFVIMPDHIHGIVIIDAPVSVVETQDFASLQPSINQHKPNRFGPQSRNLASIIRGFKIGVTTYAREHTMDFCWQARYHDRIIRTEDEWGMIRFYIHANPFRWVRHDADVEVEDWRIPM
jgi:putative transposase